MILKGISIHQKLMYLVFAIAVSLMLTLAFVNDGSANDNHMEVAELILIKKDALQYDDCWQCYHPKFYHHTLAKVWTWFNLNEKPDRIIGSQIITTLSGILTLLICLRFILLQSFSGRIKLICFSLIALNPRLLTTLTQPTNDAFIILFGTIIIYQLYHWFKRPSLFLFFSILLVTALAGATKGNSFVLIAAVSIVFLVKLIVDKNFGFSIDRASLGSLLVFVVISFFATAYFGGYYDNYKKHGEPFVYNTPVGEPPHFIKKTSFLRPGVRSVVDGYFTFRLFDMLKMPIISNNYGEEYKLHRTSVWTQLYGRSHFVYFDNWPIGAWQTKNTSIINVGRAALILALLPSLIFVLGFLKEIKLWFEVFFKKKGKVLKERNDWMYSIFNFGFLGFIILFTAFGRDYSFMKVVYLFPAILAAAMALMNGLEMMNSFFQKNKIALKIFQINIVALLILYIIPVVDVVLKLINGGSF